MINKTNIARLIFYEYFHKSFKILKTVYYLFETASIMFLSYILFELLNVGQGHPFLRKKHLST